MLKNIRMYSGLNYVLQEKWVHIFRDRIENFIKECNINSENQYHLKNNLSLIIRLPYYGKSKGTRPKGRYNHLKIMLDFCRYLIQYNDSEFTELLLTDLSAQQNQSLRKFVFVVYGK